MSTAVTNPNKFVTGEVRFSYVFINQPYQDGKYRLMAVIDKKDTKTIASINAAFETAKKQAVAEIYGGKMPPVIDPILKDGDTHPSYYDKPEYQGKYLLNLSSNQKPGIVDANMQDIIDPSEIYSGMFGRVSGVIKPYNHKESKQKGITGYLNNIQKTRDGDALAGSSATPEEDFGAGDGSDIFG